MKSTNRRMAVVTALVIAATLMPSHADITPLTLYEKTGRAPLVVWGQVLDGEHRFAEIKVLDVIKCDIPERPAQTLRVAFRLDSFLRRPWEDKIVFLDGERVALFLRKFTKEDGEKPEGDLYTLMWGAQGKVLVPPEGEEAYVGAVRAFASILTQPDIEKQEAMIRQSVFDKNPYTADTAVSEMLRQGLGDPSMLPDLITLYHSPREPLRNGAMRLTCQIVQTEKVAGRELPGHPTLPELSDLIRGLASSDPSEGFRVESVITLRALGGEESRAFLQRLAREDPSQMVRYEAQKSLLTWGQPLPSSH